MNPLDVLAIATFLENHNASDSLKQNFENICKELLGSGQNSAELTDWRKKVEIDVEKEKEWQQKAASEAANSLPFGENNTSSPKFPDKTKMLDKVREWYSGKPVFHNPSPADIARVTYDIIAENFGR